MIFGRRRWSAGVFAFGALLPRIGLGACHWVSAGGTGIQELVKTSCSDFIVVIDPSTGLRLTNAEILSHNWVLNNPGGFTAGPAATTWSGSGDSGVHTVDPVTELPPSDQDGLLGLEGPFTFATQSMADRGVYSYHVTGTQGTLILLGYDANGVPVYDYVTGPLTPTNFSFSVFNSPPTASLAQSGENHVGHSLTFTSSASDPDGGSLPFQSWDISRRPAGSTDNLSGANTPTATLAITNKLSIGNDWTVRFRAADNEGELKEFTRDFTVDNRPPTLTLTAPSPIDATGHLHLAASPTNDADGETLTWVWDITASPPSAGRQPQSGFTTGGANNQSIDFVTGPLDIGTWTFHCTVTDEHGATAQADASVVVKPIPPSITIADPVRTIRVGDTTHFNTTTLNDAYGGPLDFAWELIQVPSAAGVALGVVGTGPGITLPFASGVSSAGTWKLRLTARDQVNQVSTEVVKVLIDANPTAEILGPDQSGNLTLALDLSGAGSEDPDSGPHLGGNDISQGITQRRWSFFDVPQNLYDRGEVWPAPVSEVFNSVSDNGVNLHIPAGRLGVGHWVFMLEVTDAEGNTESTTHPVDIIEQGVAPFAIVPPANSFLTTGDGIALSNIGVNGAASFDLDNLLTSPYSPGLGITNYEWSYSLAPPGCPALPALPSGATAVSAVPYAAGDLVPPLCQGLQMISLTVRDDDAVPKTGSATSLVFIGNCPGDVCIDYPTQDNPQFVKFSDQTDVILYYHLNSALYDLAGFSSGLRVNLRIYHELDPALPAYSESWDADLLPSNRGGYLTLHWSGFTDSHRRPEPGRYDVTLRLTDAAGNPVGAAVTEPRAISIQTLDVVFATSTTRYQERGALLSGAESIRVGYDVLGQTPGTTEYDELRFRLLAPDHSQVYANTYHPPFAGSLLWNGDLGAGVVVSTGSYNMELEIFDHGASLGLSTAPLTVFQMGVGASSPTLAAGYLVANTDDDNVNGVSDLVESVPGDDDLAGFRISMVPTNEGSLVLSSTAPGVVNVFTDRAKTTAVVLPHTYAFPADPLPGELFLEGQTGGRTRIQLQFRSPDGLVRGTTFFALTSVKGEVATDSNNDYRIVSTDTARLYVQPGLWDGAFRSAADAFGAVNTLYNESDAARLAAAGNPENFVGRDNRRFYFRVSDSSANANPAAVDEIGAARFEWWTLRSTQPEVNDDYPPTQRGQVLTEIAVDSGVFVSPALMVVTDTVDLSTVTHTGLAAHPGTPAYDADNHRTRQITSVSSFVEARYRPAGVAGPVLTWRFPAFQRVPEERRHIRLHVFNFADPANLGLAPVPPAFIALSTQTFKDRYLPAGIEAQFVYNPGTDIINLPPGSPINLNSVGDFVGGYGTLAPSADMIALQAMTAPLEADPNTIRVMLIHGFTAGNRGESFPDGWLPVGSIAANFVYIADTVATAMTVSHETGHMVTNAVLTAGEASGATAGWAGGGHYGGAQDAFNIMRPVTSINNQVTDSKRFWDDTAVHTVAQVTRMRATRYMRMP